MILVFGSINIDVLVPVPHLPSAGETVLGEQFLGRAEDAVLGVEVGRGHAGAGGSRREVGVSNTAI